MLPEGARNYLLHGLGATPIVLEKLLREATTADYDRRPDPERFTLREVVAHLADWEPIWLERLLMIQSEANPTLPSRDEGQLAIDHDYAHSNPAERLARFREGRARTVQHLQALPPEAWARTGQHTQWGPLAVAALATLILGHDGYHLRQTAEWLDFGDD
jgi:uncharacterized damage-inducible protein DinB